MTDLWPYPGSRWYKFDFHTHTPCSTDTIWAKLNYDLSPEAWLLEFMNAGIDCVAITDHNTGNWIDRLNLAYNNMISDPPENFREIHIFPGVEVSVSSGLHLLVIFDVGTKTEQITKFLGKIDFYGTHGETRDVTGMSLIDILNVIDTGKFNCIAIPAHADQKKGLLEVKKGNQKSVLDSQTLIQSYESKAIAAIEVKDKSLLKPSSYNERSMSWTEVVGSDCHNFKDGSAPGKRYTWVKMESPSLESLKLALLDGQEFSIKRDDDVNDFNPFKTPDFFIESININQAKYMGLKKDGELLKFSPYSNSIVGGRGTGKSTITHCLRLASGKGDELEKDTTPDSTFKNFCKVSKHRNESGALTENTEIEIIYRRFEERFLLKWNQSDFLISVYEDVDNVWKLSNDQSLDNDRFPIDLYSQGQIAALVGDNNQPLIELIDRFANIDTRELASAELNFSAVRADMRRLQHQKDLVPSVSRQLKDTRKKIHRLSQANYKDVLQRFDEVKKQKNYLDEKKQEAIDIAKQYKEFLYTLDFNLLTINDPTRAFDNDVQAFTNSLSSATGETKNEMLKLVDNLENEINKIDYNLQKSSWATNYEIATSAYSELQERLKNEGLNNLDEYQRLISDEVSIAKQLGDLIKAKDDFATKQQISIELMLKIKLERKSITKKRQIFLSATLVNNPYVKIKIVPFGATPLVSEKKFRELLSLRSEFANDIYVKSDEKTSGIIHDFTYAASLTDEVQRDKLISDIQRKLYLSAKGSKSEYFSGFFNKKLKQLDKLYLDFSDSLLFWYPEDGLSVEYSRKGDGTHFEPISQGSAGQRAAAMLAFLLAHSKNPLFIDQPEDDLDNSLIYDMIVTQIKNTKSTRQIITVTHNPNIVVNGDAEMVHALDFNNQCYVKDAGSIQQAGMRRAICKIMEGGKTAFNHRYRRLI
ncbi:MAG: AAA family ATPase [Oceanospirillaceae bacterium]|nr:AAA family ATPase [Oceanospirillaceae bacterium]